MKKHVRNTVFFRLELTQFSVIIRFATEAEELLHGCMYSVVFTVKCDSGKVITKIQGFNNFDDAQDFIFINYAWMFIPSRQFKYEGSHLFVY